MNDSSEFPVTGVLLGLDFGHRRVGVAVSTVEQSIAVPLDTWLRAGDAEADALRLGEFVSEQQAVGLVVGLPINTDGTEGELARDARQFADWASAACGLPATMWDERFSSIRAETALRQSSLGRRQRNARRDKVAAQMMLQGFLDRNASIRKLQSE